MQIKFPIIQKYVAAAFCLLIFGASLSISAQTPLKERVEIFEEVWNTINEKYYDAAFNKIDWAAVKKNYRKRLAKVSGDKDFYALLDQMAGELHDAHTRVFSPKQQEEKRKQLRTNFGITIRKIEGKSVVTGVLSGSEAARAGVENGMIIRAVSGQSIEKAIEKALLEVGTSSSERSTEMRVYSKILSGERGTVLKLSLLDKNGRRFNVSLPRQTSAFAAPFSARLLASGVAYLQFQQFSEAVEKQIDDALEKFKDAPALIIDLRDNGGGDGETGLRFAGNFFNAPITVAKLVTRTGKPPIPEIPMILQSGSADSPVFSRRPIVILVNAGTASTSELITSAMREYGRARVFGTQSCGCVLGILGDKRLKGGGVLTVSEFGFVTSKNRTLEGTGVTPDEIVPLTLKDIQNGYDAALSQADEYLKAFPESFDFR